MKFHDKLQLLRRERGLSQEGLAEMLHVSRQAISKWESGSTYPEIDKIVTLSEIFGVTVDSLIKDGPIEYSHARTTAPPQFGYMGGRMGYEYKSKRTLWGLPLVHVNVGFGFRRARGIVAIGMISQGFLSLGLLSMGLLSFGLLSLGLIGVGVFAVGLLLAIGSISLGTFSIGAIAIGVFALGGMAIGMFSTGGLAVASHVAVGGHAYGHVAVGRIAEGARVFLDTSPGQSFAGIDGAEVRRVVGEEFPGLWNWVVRWATFALR